MYVQLLADVFPTTHTVSNKDRERQRKLGEGGPEKWLNRLENSRSLVVALLE